MDNIFTTWSNWSKWGDSWGISIEPIPKSGYPLEDHPNWFLIYGNSSLIGWDSYGRAIVPHGKTNNNGSLVAMGTDTPTTYNGAILTCDYLYDAPGSSFVLPLAKFIDLDNIIGVRLRNGNAEVVQNKNGTWSTLLSQPATTGHWSVIFSSNNIALTIDGIEQFNIDHDITGDGYFGVGGYQWEGSETLLIDNLRAEPLNYTETPVMTSPDTPYGYCFASNKFDNDYSPWKGMDNIISSSDAWVTELIDNSNIPFDSTLNVHGHYWGWWYTDAIPMIPNSFTVYPRGDMTSTWWRDNNPQGLVVFGIKAGSQPLNQTGDNIEWDPNDLTEVFRKEDIADWANGNSRSWSITTTDTFIGFVVYVTKTNKSQAGGVYHVAWSDFKMTGMYSSCDQSVGGFFGTEWILTNNLMNNCILCKG